MVLLLLVLLTAWFLVDLAANLLNARTLEQPLPESFKGVYDGAKYRQLQQYEKANTLLDSGASVASLGALLGFWFLGGFPWLDGSVRSLGLGPVLSGLLFIRALALGSRLIQLPFNLYHTFVIETRFGFNRTTRALWLADTLKGTALLALLGGGLLSVVLALLEHGGTFAWLYGWATVVSLMFIMSWLAPALILPLFNKFTPLPEGELRNAIEAFGNAHGFPFRGIFLMDGSRRSTKTNAFFTGIGKTKKIVLFDTLIARHSVEELVAVLAHEIGHYKLRHIPLHLAVASANLGIFFFLANYLIRTPQIYAAFSLQPSVYAGLALFSLYYGPLSRLLAVASLALSRRHEFEADHFASVKTGKPRALAEALRKLSLSNLTNLNPHPLQVLLYHSHPPVLERIAALENSGAPQ